MRILVVEDDPHLHRVVVKGLTEEGYAVDSATDGSDGLYLAEVTAYDLLILDIGLPGMDGLAVCHALRRKRIATPILLLTARDSIEDRVIGLDSGADDYLTKPFAFEELLARCRALLRRHSPTRSNVLHLADLELDVAGHSVRRADVPVEVTAKEFALLEYLLRHTNHVISRAQIEEHVWNGDYDSASNLIDVYIRRLRRKLDDPFEVKLIHTVKGVGYKVGIGA